MSVDHDRLDVPMPLLRRLDILRAGGAVERFHTWRTIRRQSVAEHTHGVLLLLAELAPPEHLTSKLLLAAVHHDISELLTGDLPSPVKRAHPELKDAANRATTAFEQQLGIRYELSKEQQDLLKFCDLMDLCLWALEELFLGNLYAKMIVRNALKYMAHYGFPNEKAMDFYAQVSERYNQFLEGQIDL